MSESILIIDDDRAIAQLTAIWVKSMGYKPLTAHDGRAGLAAAAAHKPQLILLDIRMPGMDGFEVNHALKLVPELAEIPVIFLSAHAQEPARQLAFSVGAVAFLSKPYKPKDLSAAISTALARHKTK